MVEYNPLTGLKRRLTRRRTNWKRRLSESSTIAARMYAKQVMDAFYVYFSSAKRCVAYAAVLMTINSPPPEMSSVTAFLLIYGAFFYTNALRMICLDSQLMDIPADFNEQTHYFHKVLVDITINYYQSDNECELKTRFTKDEILLVVKAIGLPHDYTYVYYYGNKYYKFKSDTLLIYMLRKMATGRTHINMISEFGGCPTHWGRGYSYLVQLIDTRFYPLIGPEGLSKWVHQFPGFAEAIRKYIQRDKPRDGPFGPYTLGLGHQYGPGEFNIMSLTDCSIYECCRPGSGPAHDDEASPRKEN